MTYLSLFFFSLAFLWPAHFEPLPLFYQNSFIFFSLICLLINLKEVIIDRLSIVFFILLLTMMVLEFLINKSLSDSAIYFLITIVFIIASYIIGINYRQRLKPLRLFIPVFLLTAIILFVIQTCQVYHVDSIFIKYISATSDRYYSNIGQPNILATIYVIAIAYLSFKKTYTKFLLLISIFILGVFLTKSRVGYLSVFLVCVFSIFTLNQFTVRNIIKSIYPILLLIVMFFINYLNKDSLLSSNRLNSLDSARINIYKDAINLISDRPILGYGWEAANKYLPNDNIVHFKSSLYSYHNIIFDLILSYGFIVTLIFIIIFFKIVWRNKRNNAEIFIITLPFLLHCLVEFPYYYWYLLMPFFIIIGIINKSYLNQEVYTVTRKYLLLKILFFLLMYKVFYSEYESISQNYLSIYNKECRELPKSNWVFFEESSKHIEFFCLDNSKQNQKKEIVFDSLNYTLLTDYLDTYPLKHDGLSEYTCIRYNYCCQ